MKKLWFKRKRYGWGWYPATKEGWLVLLLWLIAFVLNECNFLYSGSKGNLQVATFLSITILITLGLVVVSYLTGEKPKWQWGEKKNDQEKA